LAERKAKLEAGKLMLVALEAKIAVGGLKDYIET